MYIREPQSEKSRAQYSVSDKFHLDLKFEIPFLAQWQITLIEKWGHGMKLKNHRPRILNM